jgi:hypothetical protein
VVARQGTKPIAVPVSMTIFVEGTGRRFSVSSITTSLCYINVATLLRCSLSGRR